KAGPGPEARGSAEPDGARRSALGRGRAAAPGPPAPRHAALNIPFGGGSQSRAALRAAAKRYLDSKPPRRSLPMALDMTPEQKEIGNGNFHRVVGRLAEPTPGVTRRDFMNCHTPFGATVPVSPAVYFNYHH